MTRKLLPLAALLALAATAFADDVDNLMLKHDDRMGLYAATAPADAKAPVPDAAGVRTLAFTGVLPEFKIDLKDLGKDLPADWTDYTHLVLEMKTATPQRFGLWIYTDDGIRRIEIQPFGEGVWLRACIPLEYLKAQVTGGDLAAATNRRTNSFWMSVWGPWGDLKTVRAVGFSMEYPINHATVKLRNVHLAKADEKSEFLETPSGVDQFGQWAVGDWPRKIHSQEQLTKELADEAAHFNSGADYGYDKWGGYADTKADGGGTGFFRVQQMNGKWWFVDPDGHLYISTGVNGAGAGFGAAGGGRGRGNRGAPVSAQAPSTQPAAPPQPSPADALMAKRLESWGMTTGGVGRPNTVFLRWRTTGPTLLGLPDVYDANFVSNIDQQANQQCAARKDDPLVLGYFIGNEPPWGGRESEVVDMILAGADSGTKAKLKEFLAAGDTPKRRRQFVIDAFRLYVNTICDAVRKYDPHHLILGIRYGGTPSDEVMEIAKVFDVCSINVYEYEPTKQIARTARLTGRPVLIGEFHIGVPENGLGAGLVQAKDQTERGNAYRYFVEQAASLDSFVGAYWFQWRDEPVLGRMDGENYNIGFVDVTDRPYAELVAGAEKTFKRLKDVHAGKEQPYAEHPKASDAGAPSSPWDVPHG